MQIKKLTSGDLSSYNVNYLIKQKVQRQAVHALLSGSAVLGSLAFHVCACDLMTTRWLPLLQVLGCIQRPEAGRQHEKGFV